MDNLKRWFCKLSAEVTYDVDKGLDYFQSKLNLLHDGQGTLSVF